LVTIPINNFKTNLTDEKFREILKLLKENYNKEFPIEPIKPLSQTGIFKLKSSFANMRMFDYKKLLKKRISDLILSRMNKEDANKKANEEITLKNTKLNFDFEYINKLRIECNDRCKISNLPIVWEPKELLSVSIDRIDSSIYHTKDNIQITAWYINCFKKDLPDETVKKIIEEIIIHKYSLKVDILTGFIYVVKVDIYTFYAR